MSLTIKKADGKNFTVSGYKFSQTKLGSFKLATSKYNSEDLPQKVDLRNFMTKVENQEELKSCTANAVAGAYEYLVKRHKEMEYDVSRLFIYYNARYIGNMESKDAGCYIADAIQGLKEYGACSEETYPYQKQLVNTEPHQDAYDEAASFLVESVERIDNELNAWKSALAEGNPIIFGLLLFASFDNHRKKGLVPVPSEADQSRASHSGHAMLCVGYSDPDQVFIVRNSWGQNWGDGGYCYIPYKYLINDKFNMGDSWIINRLDNFEDDKEEYWSDEEESILDSLESEIGNMSDEEYETMTEAMGDYPVEQRIALILLWAASSDELSDEEYSEIASYLEKILSFIGIECNVEELLQNTNEYVGNEELLEESVSLLNEYLSKKALAQTITDVENIIGVDEYSAEEEEFVSYLIESWQISEDDFVQNDSTADTDEESGDYEEENADSDNEEDTEEEDTDYEEGDTEEEDADYEEDDADYEEDDADYEEDDADYEEDDADYEEEDGKK
jgi:C1A family cysteine protease